MAAKVEMQSLPEFDPAKPGFVAMHGKKGTMTAAVEIDGNTVSIEHFVTGTHRYVWPLEDQGETCDGSITTHGPNRVLDWDITTCRKTDLDWDAIRPRN